MLYASLLILPLLTSPPFLLAKNNNSNLSSYYQGGADGWFWYDYDPEPELEETEPEPIIEQPPVVSTQPTKEPEEELKPLSVAWLKVNMPIYLDRAIDDPTPENVEAYKFLERIAMDKSQRFAEMSIRTILGNPMLDEAMRRPLADFGALQLNRESKENTDSRLKAIAKESGLYFFFASTCGFCEKQAPVLKMLERVYGYSILPVSLDGGGLRNNVFPDFVVDQGQAKRFGVRGTPSLFLANTKSGDIIHLGEGLMSLDNLKERILNISLRAGWINEQQFDKTRPIRNIMRTDRPETLEENQDLLPSQILEIMQTAAQNKAKTDKREENSK